MRNSTDNTCRMFRRSPELRRLAEGLWTAAGMEGLCPDNLRTFLLQLELPTSEALPARPDDILLAAYEPTGLVAGDVLTWEDELGLGPTLNSTGTGAHPQAAAQGVVFTAAPGATTELSVTFADGGRALQGANMTRPGSYGVAALVTMPDPAAPPAVAPYIWGDTINGCFATAATAGFYTIRTGVEELILTPDPASPLTGYMLLCAEFLPLQTNAKLTRPRLDLLNAQAQDASANAAAYLGSPIAGACKGGIQVHGLYLFDATDPSAAARLMRYIGARYQET